MYQKAKKLLAAMCVFALILGALPAIPAKAATAVPKFKKTYASVYENGVDKGKYTYTVINLKKGQTVKWSVSGAGKSYVSLKNTSTKATGTTVSNVLTVKTGGKTAAKNKKVELTAKVYSAAGKLQYTVKASTQVKIKPTKVVITAPKEADETLFVGESYHFGYQLTPANATSTNVWTVTGEDGADYSSYMSSSGIFKPMKTGIYTIKIAAKIPAKINGKKTTKTIKSASMNVDVADYMVSAKQTASDKIEISYSGDVRAAVEAGDFSVKSTAGAGMVVKNAAFAEDGKTVTLTMYSNFKDGVSYTVGDRVKTLDFKASVGTPVELKILTEKATVGKETAIEYALYDINKIDVTSAYPGTVEYSAEVTNGYLNDANKLYMTTPGKTATVTLKYAGMTDNALKLEATSVITCVAAQTSGETNFTLTNTMSEPDYTAGTYKDVRKISIGNTYYAHFRALDTDRSEIKYSSVTYESSDPDTLIITPAGKVTPIRSGNVKIIATAVYAGENYTYSYDVTIAEAPYLKTIQLSQDSVTMSNVYNMDYRTYIQVTAKDQYGDDFPLTSETANFTDNNVYKQNLVTYDTASDCIIVKAASAVPGTFPYTLSLTQDGKKASATLSVNVVSVPSTGAETYAIEIDKEKTDLSLNADVTDSQYVNARLSRYRAGVFMEYKSYISATVTKDGYYYGSDLTAGGTTTKQSLSASSILRLKTLDISSGVCRKAETGTYTISMQYYSSDAKGYVILTTTLRVTDTQDEPEISVDRIKSSKSCANALELAQNCLTPENGIITECEVTGETQPGSKVALKSGDQINIRSVTVVSKYTIAGGKSVTVTYTISVGRTLTNI